MSGQAFDPVASDRSLVAHLTQVRHVLLGGVQSGFFSPPPVWLSGSYDLRKRCSGNHALATAM